METGPWVNFLTTPRVLPELQAAQPLAPGTPKAGPRSGAVQKRWNSLRLSEEMARSLDWRWEGQKQVNSMTACQMENARSVKPAWESH